jgi:pimeloyl-ACP methyl ester carboxylesterase
MAVNIPNRRNRKPRTRRRALLGMVVAIVVTAFAVITNTIWVDSQTRAAVPRDGGTIIETGIEPANVKVEGQGPPILLLHGYGGAIDWWDDIAPALSVHHRVIRLDLIGHGGTAAPTSGYEITRQAELVSAVLDKLGVTRVTVVGHSMGGWVATALACMKSERIERLILIDSPPTSETVSTSDACCGSIKSPASRKRSSRTDPSSLPLVGDGDREPINPVVG